MPKCDFNKVAWQLYWNHTSVWVSCKFAVNFQNIFYLEHLSMAAFFTRGSIIRNASWKLLDKAEYVLTHAPLFVVDFLGKNINILILNATIHYILFIKRFKDPLLSKTSTVQFFSLL